MLKQASDAYSDKPMGVQRAAVVNMSSVLGSITQNDQGGFYPYRCSKVFVIKQMVEIRLYSCMFQRQFFFYSVMWSQY